MEIELWNGTAKAIVDPLGAWMTNLSDDNGDILYPKRKFQVDGTSKERGGLFVCAPNFGPGGSSGLPQHGFARMQQWEVIDKTENSVLLKLPPQDENYRNGSFVVSYQLNDHTLIATLDIANDSDREMRVSPGFHPYFATQDNTVMANGIQQDLSELHEVIFEEAKQYELSLAGRQMVIASRGLTMWGKWTDELGSYVCLEPTLAGFSFLNDTQLDAEVLEPGETKTFTFRMTW